MMKTLWSYLCALALFLFVIGSPLKAKADIFTSDEFQVTSSEAAELLPSVCEDSTGTYVVYTSRTRSDTGYWNYGEIYYQRFDADGPIGEPVLISNSATDNYISDCSGEYIVYTAYEDISSPTGDIKLYQISTGVTKTLPKEVSTNEVPRIYGGNVVWRQNNLGDGVYEFMRFNLQWDYGTPPQKLGRSDLADKADIGDRLAVWTERVDDTNIYNLDIKAFDLINETTINVTNTPEEYERMPVTTGSWIFWESFVPGTRSGHTEGVNIDTGETRLIADHDTRNYWPSAFGDYVGYTSNLEGTYDVYVYEIPSQRTGQIKLNSADHVINDVYKGYVAYHDRRNGEYDVFISRFKFNDLPVIHLSDTFVRMEPGTTVSVSATLTDPDNDPVEIIGWFVEQSPQGSSPYIAPTDQETMSFTPDLVGSYLVGLRVTDGLEEETAYVEFEVTDNHPPVLEDLTATPQEGLEPLSVQFSVNAYDPENGPISLEWDFGDGSMKSTETNPDHLYWTKGAYTVTLTATDTLGQSTTEQLTVSVYQNMPPRFSPVANPWTGPAPLTVQFYANATDPEGQPLSFDWTFGDPLSGDNTSALENPTHTYAEPGEYTVTLIVSDGGPSTNAVTFSIIVDSPIAFSVNKATVMWPNPLKKNWGLVNFVADVGMSMPQPSEMVEVSFDDVLLGSAPFGDFLKVPEAAETYRYEAPQLTMELDFEAGTLSVVKNKVDMDDVDLSDGAEVRFTVNGVSTIEHITMEMQNKNKWVYRKQ